MAIGSTPFGLDEWLPGFLSVETRPEMVERWVERTTQAIRAEVPDVARFDGLVADIADTVRDHWLAFLAEFAEPTFSFHLVDRGRELAAELARLQVPLEMLIRFYRIALQSTWQYITEVVTTLPADRIDHAAVIIYFWDRASTWIDRSITVSVDIYEAERSRLAAGVDAQRFDTVQAVLAGQQDDVRRISAALGGYPISAHHTALVLTCDDEDAVARLEQTAGDLARSVGVANPLLVRPGGRRLWAWIATRDVLDPAPLVAAFAATDRGRTAVGVGSSTYGVGGFASSHTEAQGAQRMAGGPHAARIQVYADVELLLLLGCSTEVDQFVARTLGGLLGDDDASQRVRETVAAFLASGGNVDETARELRVHRNTVRYRLGQAEELIGRPIARMSAEMAIAVSHLQAFHPDGTLGGA